MANIDDELIGNLRKALDAHTRTGSCLELLSAASEIVTEASERPTRVLRDADSDFWREWPSHPGTYCVAGSDAAGRCNSTDPDHGWPLKFITERYGPLVPVED